MTGRTESKEKRASVGSWAAAISGHEQVPGLVGPSSCLPAGITSLQICSAAQESIERQHIESEKISRPQRTKNFNIERYFCYAAASASSTAHRPSLALALALAGFWPPPPALPRFRYSPSQKAWLFWASSSLWAGLTGNGDVASTAYARAVSRLVSPTMRHA